MAVLGLNMIDPHRFLASLATMRSMPWPNSLIATSKPCWKQLQTDGGGILVELIERCVSKKVIKGYRDLGSDQAKLQ